MVRIGKLLVTWTRNLQHIINTPVLATNSLDNKLAWAAGTQWNRMIADAEKSIGKNGSKTIVPILRNKKANNSSYRNVSSQVNGFLAKYTTDYAKSFFPLANRKDKWFISNPKFARAGSKNLWIDNIEIIPDPTNDGKWLGGPFTIPFLPPSQYSGKLFVANEYIKYWFYTKAYPLQSGKWYYRRADSISKAESATPGRSNHGYGIAIDIDRGISQTALKWLIDNVVRYGWAREPNAR